MSKGGAPDEQEHGIASVVTVAGLLATVHLIYGHIGTDFLPRIDEVSIILDYHTPPRASLAAADAMLRYAEKVGE